MDRYELFDYYKNLDRAFFIGGEYKELASFDSPLPIGHGQTISQPSLVLEMTYLLSIDKNCNVLEIGTGSGYQTALLARYAKKIFTVEKIPELSQKAEERLKMLGFDNICFKTGDGSEGWAEYAPYDRIMVTAAAEKMPDAVVAQLGKHGRMIIPLGGKGMQDLMLITVDGKGNIKTKSMGKVTFVEMKGKYGWTAD